MQKYACPQTIWVRLDRKTPIESRGNCQELYHRSQRINPHREKHLAEDAERRAEVAPISKLRFFLDISSDEL